MKSTKPNREEDGSEEEGQICLVVGVTRTGGRAWAGLSRQSAARPSSPINVSVCTHTTHTFTHFTSLVSDRRTQDPGWLRPEDGLDFAAERVPVTRARLSLVRLLVATNSCPRRPPEGHNSTTGGQYRRLLHYSLTIQYSNAPLDTWSVGKENCFS